MSQFFFELTPDKVLTAVESAGFECTGRCLSLNSFENRVYDVELEPDALGDDVSISTGVATRNRRVAKFYRPGRWSKQQILEEHQFLFDLQAAEIPAIAPLRFPDGESVHETDTGILFAIFPKVGGRAPDELSDEQLIRIGRLLGRVHAVGASRSAPHRVSIDVQTYGRTNLEFLLKGGFIPVEFRGRYEKVANGLFEKIDAGLKGVLYQRIHGDCHLGNLLWNQEGPFFLDFDDMVRGPQVQDIWLLVPGRDPEARRQREVLIEGYEEMRVFDRSTLRLIEPLRALRFIHYTAWVARRWEDPAFPLAFPEFGSHRYWSDETGDLEEQLRLILTPDL